MLLGAACKLPTAVEYLPLTPSEVSFTVLHSCRIPRRIRELTPNQSLASCLWAVHLRTPKCRAVFPPSLLD